MLNLPAGRKQRRQWQVDFFKAHHMYFEHSILFKDRANTLNLQAMENHEFEPLNISLLREVLQPAYVETINKVIMNSRVTLSSKRVQSNLFSPISLVPRLSGLPGKYKLHDYTLANQENRAYCEYLTLKPIENLIRQRNSA
jgi:hypothetical protein